MYLHPPPGSYLPAGACGQCQPGCTDDPPLGRCQLVVMITEWNKISGSCPAMLFYLIDGFGPKCTLRPFPTD